jgi:transcription antitermination factor NusG
MAAVFTPGLKVTERTIVVKDRQLPLEGEVMVKVGDHVKADQIVARTQLPGKIFPVNVANQLGVAPSRLKGLLRKDIGDSVEKDEIIAESPGIMGFFKSEAAAIVSGTIQSISEITGQVIFQAHPIPVEIDAYIDGTVVEIIPDEGCIIQSAATLIQGIFGLGGEVKAELVMGVSSPTEVLKPEHITSEMRGKIVIGGAYLTLATLKQAIALGLAGVVTGGFDYDDIKALLGYEVGVAITGGEDLGLTLVVTEGFGEIQMAPGTFALLQKKAGQMASINGATQIRAGVIRPEVVITYGEDVPEGRYTPPEPTGISMGDPVRGIRAPYFGQLGTVVELPVEPEALESESRARVMVIEFEDGTRARLPRANVEVIES